MRGMNAYTTIACVLTLTSAMLAGCAAPEPQQPASALPAAVNTDPSVTARNLVLPQPANPALPSLILIGDSTVRNGRDDGQGQGPAGQWGWGNPVAAYFDHSKINVVNRAIGGLSSRTYLTGGHWERTLALVKAGDVVIMQFGHNDAGPVNDTSRARGTIAGTGNEAQEIDNLLTGKHETVHSYGWYLRHYIAQVRARGAVPLICTPVPRKRWDAQGRIARGANSYPAWAAQVAREEKVGLIDLAGNVARQYDALGRDAVMRLFPQTSPEENTHTNWAGAQLNARAAVAGIKALRVPTLMAALSEQAAAIAPAATDPADGAPSDRGPTVRAPADDERPVVDGAAVPQELPRIAALPSLWIVGDSTVRSGGANGAVGWGERIGRYFDPGRVNVVNHAIGGRSSRTFYTEGRWDKVLAQLKAGDVVLIQFGHNDGGRIGDPAMKNRASGPGTGPETVEEAKPDGAREQVHTFGWYMARYVDSARAKGAQVVLLSPVPHKDRWQQGRDFEQFAQWDAEVARTGGAHFVDLTLAVADGYRGVGAQHVDGFFSDARTHTNDAGARFNAERVLAVLKGLQANPVAGWLSEQGRAVAPASASSSASVSSVTGVTGDVHQHCDLAGRSRSLLHADDFKQGLGKWVAEFVPAQSAVTAAGGKLTVDVAGGATVWFKPVLEGDYLVRYRRKVLMAGGRNDRLSDLNQFWMAQDPASPDLYTRDGTFEQYDGLRLYYAGIGGNGNTTTRLRRYGGNGERVLLGDSSEARHLLQANRDYLVEVAVVRGCTQIALDGAVLFSYRDPQPLRSGHFGFRTTQSRQEISDFEVFRLD